MSTLKVDNLLNAAGNESPISVPGAAKAWVNYDGSSGTTGQNDTTIRSSYNVSSVTNNASGDYTVNFTNNMPNANYAAICSGGNNASSGEGAWVATYDNATNTVSGVRIATYQSDGSGNDPTEQVSVVVFGD